MRVELVRTPAGNFDRLAHAIERAGASVTPIAPEEVGPSGDGLVLAGVSSFGTVARATAPARGAIRQRVATGSPVLGICAGFQALYDSSEESEGAGLGLLPGRVRALRSRRLPNLGWSRIEALPSARLLAGVPPGSYAYFAHSFRAPDATGPVAATTAYDGERFPSAVELGRLFGLQFHPELSGAVGRDVLANFVRLCREARA